MAEEHEEEEDGMGRGEWVKVKGRAPLPCLQYRQTNHSRSKHNVTVAHDLAVHMENVEANRHHPLRA